MNEPALGTVALVPAGGHAGAGPAMGVHSLQPGQGVRDEEGVGGKASADFSVFQVLLVTGPCPLPSPSPAFLRPQDLEDNSETGEPRSVSESFFILALKLGRAAHQLTRESIFFLSVLWKEGTPLQMLGFPKRTQREGTTGEPGDVITGHVGPGSRARGCHRGAARKANIGKDVNTRSLK